MEKMMAMCSRCGQMAHSPESCPMVKAIDYYPDGMRKRVEYHEQNPQAPIQFTGAESCRLRGVRQEG